MPQGPTKIALTVCTGCDFRQDVGTRRINDHAIEASYGCTNPDVIRVTMPVYSFKVFGKSDEWVKFVQLDKVGKWPVPCGNCSFVKENQLTEKPILTRLLRDDPATSEGKYLVKRRDGTVVEWPHFVLGARDPHAIAALKAYAESIAKDPDCHPGLVESILKLAEDFTAYRLTHGTGDPTRGRHRIDDPATIAEMRKSKSA